MSPAVLAVARAEVRRRWLALVLLGVLAGAVAGLATGAVAVARRTDTSVQRLAVTAGVGDAVVTVYGDTSLAPEVSALDVVDASWLAPAWTGLIDGPEFQPISVLADDGRPRDLFHPTVIEGRMFDEDAVDEVVMFEAFARETGITVGTEIPIRLLTTAQTYLFEQGFGEPAGPSVTLHVVGTVRTSALVDQLPPFIASSAFARAFDDVRAGATFVSLRLRDGLASGPDLEAGLQRLQAGAAPVEGLAATSVDVVYPARTSSDSVTSSKGLLVGGLLAFSIVVAVAGMLAVGQTLTRQHEPTRAAAEVQAVLGMTLLERIASRALPSGITVGVAAALGGIGGIVAGWVEPIGALRSFEPTPGFAPNITVAVVGTIGTALVASAVACVATLPSSIVRRRPAVVRASPLTERLVATGGAPAVVVGARMAFEPQRHREGVPVRSVRLGLVLAVVGVVAVLVVTVNLARLITEPERYGFAADFVVSDVQPEWVSELLDDPRVEALSVMATTPVTIEGRSLYADALDDRRGQTGWTLLQGTFPATSDEVVVGSRIAEQLGHDVGEIIAVELSGQPPIDLRVVGIGLGPDSNSGQLGANVLLSLTTLERSAGEINRAALVRVQSDVDPATVMADYSSRWEVHERHVPAEVDNLQQVGLLPKALASFFAAIGLAALANGLVVAVRRRCTTIAVLRTIGFTPRQAGTTILTMTGAVSLIAVLVGVPLGVALGSVVWRAIAVDATISPDVFVPAMSAVLVGAAALVASFIVAALPARRAARLRPADILHQT